MTLMFKLEKDHTSENKSIIVYCPILKAITRNIECLIFYGIVKFLFDELCVLQEMSKCIKVIKQSGKKKLASPSIMF